MDLIEAYLLLFTDSLVGSLIVPPRTEYILDTMKSFGTYNDLHITLIAIIGSVIGLIINYGFGIMLRSVKKGSFEAGSPEFIKLANFLNKYGSFLMIFSFIPVLSSILSVLCGFTKSRFKIFILFAIIARTIYYFFIK